MRPVPARDETGESLGIEQIREGFGRLLPQTGLIQRLGLLEVGVPDGLVMRRHGPSQYLPGRDPTGPKGRRPRRKV